MKRIVIFVCLGLIWSCNSNSDPEPTLPNCDSPPNLTLVSKTDLVDCTISDGIIIVLGNGGTGTLQYSIDGSTFQSSGTFENLASGTYELTVKDEKTCEAMLSVVISNPGSTVTITNIETADTGCKTSNGNITVNAEGIGTLSYSLNGSEPQTTNIFSGLTKGAYSIAVTDDSGCEVISSVNLLTGVSYSSQINNILQSNCVLPTCHNGDNGATRNWTVFSNVKANASNIKSRTQSGNMPPANSGQTLTQQEKDLIACWVDDGAINN